MQDTPSAAPPQTLQEESQVKANRKLLSTKTQKLVEAAAAISDTLQQLDKQKRMGKDAEYARNNERKLPAMPAPGVDQPEVAFKPQEQPQKQPAPAELPVVYTPSSVGATAQNTGDSDQRKSSPASPPKLSEMTQTSATEVGQSNPQAAPISDSGKVAAPVGGHNAGSPPDSDQAAVIEKYTSRITQLELDLAESTHCLKEWKLSHSGRTSKYDVLKHQHQDLQMRASRQELEMKSLIEQNEILRSESRRMTEVESALRLKIVELSQPAPHPAPPSLDPSDQVLQERIVQQIDQQLGWISVHLFESNDRQTSHNHLTTYQESLEAVKKSTKSATLCTPKSILNLCQTVTTVLTSALTNGWELLRDGEQFETKFERLKAESLLLNQEATVTIQKLKQSHEESTRDLTASNKKMKHQLKSITEKYQQLQSQLEELIATNHELSEENQALVLLAQRPQVHPEVVLMPDGQNGVFEKQLEELQKRNRDLHIHIDTLGQTIEGWKEENSTIQNELAVVRQEKAGLEREQLQSIKKMGDVMNQLEDEKLRSQKAAELAKSLQSQLDAANDDGASKRSDYAPTLEHIMQEQLHAIKSIAAPTATPTSPLETKSAETQILNCLKELDSKSKKLQQLELFSKGQEHTISTLEQEIAKLKSKISLTKDKFQVREVAWLEKLKKFKSDQEEAIREVSEVKSVLHTYHDQYQTICSMFEAQIPSGAKGSESHPYSFAALFNALHHRTDEISNRCHELEKQLNDTRSAFEATSKDLLVQVKQMETLGSESSDTRSRLLQVTSEKAQLEMSLKDSEKQLRTALDAKREACERLKLVVERVAEYVHAEMVE
ncbi:hypothetical protein HDU91_002268 [Kappamyces sp. JEL0680]|nr:hypothetical protein HDU91_002268 [Kappamyces sp. JEL0680]